LASFFFEFEGRKKALCVKTKNALFYIQNRCFPITVMVGLEKIQELVAVTGL
jgi:hypothetical protein